MLRRKDMEHPFGELTHYAGISKRTLRYYDEIGLLKPKKTTSDGYRLYGEESVNRLQQILFYRELDFHLKTIPNLTVSKLWENIYRAYKRLEEKKP